MVRLDFINLDGANYTVTNLVGTQLPVNRQAFIWDRTLAAYKTETRTIGGWTPGTNQINRGGGFFLRAPAGAGVSNTYTVYFMGEVPDAITAPTTTVGTLSGLNLVGYPYPAEILWTNTHLAKTAVVNDQLFVWSVSNQAYTTYTRTIGGWGAATNVTIFVGQGFFSRKFGTNTVLWTEVKPYTWP
jgi:hypothetical protein